MGDIKQNKSSTAGMLLMYLFCAILVGNEKWNRDPLPT